MNAIGEFHFMEVDEEPERHIHEFHVAEQLCFVNRQHILQGFGLNKNAFFHEHIEPQRLLSFEPFVVDNDDLLTRERHAA